MDNLRKLWDNMKCNNTSVIGMTEGEEREQVIENLLEKIMTENFSDLLKKKDTQVQETESQKR